MSDEPKTDQPDGERRWQFSMTVGKSTMRLLVIAAAVPFMSLPFIFYATNGTELSWLQIVSTALLGAAAALAISERMFLKIRRICQYALPRVVEFIALAVLGLIVLWSIVTND